jgi:hypothetical protein
LPSLAQNSISIAALSKVVSRSPFLRCQWRELVQQLYTVVCFEYCAMRRNPVLNKCPCFFYWSLILDSAQED